MSIRDVEEFVEWEIISLPAKENELLTEFVRFTTNKEKDNIDYEKLVQSYAFCMAHYPTLYKFGENYDLNDHTVNTYFQKAVHRTMWQVTQIRAFLIMCFGLGGSLLQEEPVKIASNRYEETLRVERPQHDLVTDMELELSRLPRYQAYAKIIDESQDRQLVRTHRIQTHPLPERTNMNMEAQAIAKGHLLGKKRDAIEEEIRERQSRWRPGAGKAPQTSRRRE
jgi:hypothetical protein